MTDTATRDDTPLRFRQFHLAVWRWHFYAGLLVLPVLALQALTGMLMLVQPPLDVLRHAERYEVRPEPVTLSPEEQVRRVQAEFPHRRVVAYLPAPAPNRSAQIAIAKAEVDGAHGGHGPPPTETVFVDPHLGTILAVQDPDTTFYAWAKGLHGTLLLGEVGDVVLEVLAGFAVLMVCSGLYLAWPRGAAGWAGRLLPPVRLRQRQDGRELHAALGMWLALPLLFFLISGLAWTGFWGGSLVQAWSSIPAAKLDAPPGEHTHESLNRAPLSEVPWALEQTPLPRSGAPLQDPHAGVAVPPPVNLDRVVTFARTAGFPGFRVHLPADAQAPWTVSASTLAGDVTDPRLDRTVHIDAESGRVLADIGFADYPLMGKAMAAGVPLHQAGLGVWNLILNAAFCLMVMLLCVAAAAAWWRRRPAGARRLVAPPLPQDPAVWKWVMVVMLAAAVAFPLTALALVTVVVLDLLLAALFPPLRCLLR